MHSQGPEGRLVDRDMERMMRFPELRRVEHVGLGLYGLAIPPDDVGKIFDWVVAFFGQLGCAPTEIGSDVAGSRGKLVPYARGLKRWRAASAEAGHFTLHSVPEHAKDRSEAENAGATWRRDEELIITFSPSRVGERTQKLLELAREVTELSQPQYGIIYRLPFCFGPLEYGIGLNTGWLLPIGNIAHIVRYRLYRFLRNVYRWNFLTELQLNALVNAQRLEDWIRQDARRGTLEPFAGKMTLWTVREDEQPAIRQALDDAGIIFNYERDLWGTQQKYRCTEPEAADYLRTGKVPTTKPPEPSKPPLEIEDVLRQLGVEEGEEVLRKGEDGKLHRVKPPRKKKN